MLWKLLLIPWAIMIAIFIALVSHGIPALYAASIFIYPTVLLIAFLLLSAWLDRHSSLTDNADEKEEDRL